MPRAKNDAFKRACAQALNHQAAAILDINTVYEAFYAQVEKLTGVHNNALNELGRLLEQEQSAEIIAEAHLQADTTRQNVERYQGYVEQLKTMMMGVMATREHLILFIGEVYNLDEDSIKVYMG